MKYLVLTVLLLAGCATTHATDTAKADPQVQKDPNVINIGDGQKALAEFNVKTGDVTYLDKAKPELVIKALVNYVGQLQAYHETFKKDMMNSKDQLCKEEKKDTKKVAKKAEKKAEPAKTEPKK